MQIREARHPTDTDAIVELYRATPELPGNAVLDFLDATDLHQAFLASDRVFLVVENGEGKLVGFIYVKVRTGSAPEEQARLLHLVVVHGRRGQGIARELLNECKKRLVARGISHLYFNVNGANQPMTWFALRSGFRPTRVSVRFDLDFGSEGKLQPPLDELYDLRFDD